MPFLRAGFNPENRSTGIRGWTRPAAGGGFWRAQLHRFECGDFFWLGAKPRRFLAWGEQVSLGTWHGFSLPWGWQHSLPRCDIETRREYLGQYKIPETLEEALAC